MDAAPDSFRSAFAAARASLMVAVQRPVFVACVAAAVAAPACGGAAYASAEAAATTPSVRTIVRASSARRARVRRPYLMWTPSPFMFADHRPAGCGRPGRDGGAHVVAPPPASVTGSSMESAP